MYPYSHVISGGRESVTVFMPTGSPIIATADHPHFAAILEGAKDGIDADELRGLADRSFAAAQRFDALSERVAVANGHVYFDGDKVDSTITQQIVRCLDDPDAGDWRPLVLFMENIAANPNEHSRAQLFDWLRDREFTITSNGSFIAFKGVSERDADDGYPYQSSSQGSAIVNGERFDGHIPNAPGAVVEMPRGEVNHNPSAGCSTGLHVGTHEYAQGYASGALLTVLVNPRDVVSVPTDCAAQKMRVCRYVVADDEARHPSESPAIEHAERYPRPALADGMGWPETFVKTGEVRPPRAGEFYLYGEGTDEQQVGRAIIDYTEFGEEYAAPILETSD